MNKMPNLALWKNCEPKQRIQIVEKYLNDNLETNKTIIINENTKFIAFYEINFREEMNKLNQRNTQIFEIYIDNNNCQHFVNFVLQFLNKEQLAIRSDPNNIVVYLFRKTESVLIRIGDDERFPEKINLTQEFEKKGSAVLTIGRIGKQKSIPDISFPEIEEYSNLSRVHATLFDYYEYIEIEDGESTTKKSTNGVLIKNESDDNFKKINKQKLKDNDIISFGGGRYCETSTYVIPKQKTLCYRYKKIPMKLYFVIIYD